MMIVPAIVENMPKFPTISVELVFVAAASAFLAESASPAALRIILFVFSLTAELFNSCVFSIKDNTNCLYIKPSRKLSTFAGLIFLRSFIYKRCVFYLWMIT